MIWIKKYLFFLEVLSLMLFLGLIFSGTAYAGTLSCSITTATACTGGTNTVILRMSGITNAHAELPSQANANYASNVVCCSGVTGLSNACTAPSAVVLKLSGLTNAHSEQNSQSNYANSACISVPSGGSVTIGYQASNCTGYDTTLGSISGTTNGHVGDSTAYTTKICAMAAGPAAPILTIGVTAGSKIANLNSGDTSKYANDIGCTGPSGCAAFTLSLSSGSETITSIKITETGTADANNNLANLALFYDTDGNYSNGVTGQYGSAVASFTNEAATVSGSLAISSGTTYYFYVRFDLVKSATYPKGGQTVDFQVAADNDVVTSGSPTKTGAPVTLAGTTYVLPNATATTYGSGLGDGGRSAESITISGYGFGVAGAGSRANCSGAVDTGCVRFTVGGNTTVADGDVTAWSNTSITYTINASLASDGGASAVEVVAGSQSDATKLTFYIYPRVSSITVPTAVANAAREYLAGDTDGLIQLNGDHFGSAGSATILGSSATQHATAEGPCSTGGGYSSTKVCLEVPAAIADNLYTGNVILTRTSDSKTHTYGSTFRVLPRITSLTPDNGVIGTQVVIAGNHLCGTGSCPTAGSRSSVTYNVKFNTVQVTDGNVTAWFDTSITANSPDSTTGNVIVTGGDSTWTSNGKTYTYLAITLTIGATAGSKVTNLNSGDTSQYANVTGCSAPASCAAFTLSISSGSETITSIKITETGTADANNNLANLAIFYDTDGNYSNGVTGQYGSTVAAFTSEAATVSGSLAISAGTTYYFYVRFDLVKSGTYPSGGQTVNFQVATGADVGTSGTPTKTGPPVSLAGTTTVKPQITGYTNSTETGLNYAASCSGCGARIGPAASAQSQTVVITGYGFGADPGLGNRDTATNKVEIASTTTTLIADNGAGNTNVTAWSNTSITITTDIAVTSNSDADWTTNFGGASTLKITAGSQAVPTNLNFYIFPQITSLTVNTGVSNAAREYDAGDNHGVITLNGTRFGSSQSTGYVRILGCDSSTCSSPTGSVAIDSWSNTAIQARVPTVIDDGTYTGSISMQQGTGANSKTHSFSTLRILPRITSLNPSSGLVSDPITVNGNHFCQNAAVCPVSFDANNRVVFYNGVPATVFTSWSHTVMSTGVPTGAVTGDAYLKSNNYDSNNKNFIVISNTPSDPDLTPDRQFRNSGLTLILSVGSTASSTPIYLTMTMEVPGASGGTLYPQIEYKAIGTSFTCSGGGTCASAIEGNGKAGPGPWNCSSSANNCSISISPVPSLETGEVYHWQARVRHNRGGADYYSNWVSYGSNPEGATDFKIDTTAPSITSGPTTSPQTNSVQIDWSTANEQSTSRVQYNKTGTFGDCPTDCTTLDPNQVYNHSVSVYNLDSGTTYYYRVRSKDAVGNETISSTNNFATQSVTTPAKTTSFYINTETGPITVATTSYFSVLAPETSPTIKSAFVEVTGLVSGGSGTVTLQVNAVSSRTYSVNATNPTKFRFVYQITSPNSEINLNLNDDSPCTNGSGGVAPCNKLVVTPGSGLTIDIASAKISVTYSYTP